MAHWSAVFPEIFQDALTFRNAPWARALAIQRLGPYWRFCSSGHLQVASTDTPSSSSHVDSGQTGFAVGSFTAG